MLKAQAVFVSRAIFDREMNARLSAGDADARRRLVAALRVRIPANVPDAEIELLVRGRTEMALDGLLTNLVTRADEGERFQNVWTQMVDLLLVGKNSENR